MRLLLEGGASVGATNGGGASALYIACQEEQIECARLLVEAGAATDQADAEGCTPLLIAYNWGWPHVSRNGNFTLDQPKHRPDFERTPLINHPVRGRTIESMTGCKVVITVIVIVLVAGTCCRFTKSA